MPAPEIMSPRDRDKSAVIYRIQRITVLGLVVNLVLAVAKCTTGLLGGSQALVADAIHSLSDSVTDVAVIVGAHLWTAPADQKHPHGHGRIETVISFVIGLVLASVGLGLAWQALSSIHMLGQSSPPGWPTLVVALFSIASKEVLYRWTYRIGLQTASTALKANAWHHRSDGLSSVPVALAVVGSHFRPEWVFLDPVAAVIVSVFVFQAAWRIVAPAFAQLVDSGLSSLEIEDIKRLALATGKVRQIHAIRSRHIGTGIQLDCHLLVDPLLTVREGHAIAHEVKQSFLKHHPHMVDVLIHVEPDESSDG